MQRRSAAGSSAADGGLPLTVADISTNGKDTSSKGGSRTRRAARPTCRGSTAALPGGNNQMKLRRRKRKTKRSSLRRRRTIVRVVLCGCASAIVVFLVLSLMGRGPFGSSSRRASSYDQSASLAYVTSADGFAPLTRMLFSFGDELTANPEATCEDRDANILLNRQRLDSSLALGLAFLTDHQRPEGNFDYEYDWKTDELSEDDSSVRQAGALWGLSLIFHDMMDTRHREEESRERNGEGSGGALWGLSSLFQGMVDTRGRNAQGSARDSVLRDVVRRLREGIDFFRKNSRILNRPITDDDHGAALVGINKMRYIQYPGDQLNDAGCQALVCLALIEFLRGLNCEQQAAPTGVSADEIDDYQELLDEFLPFLVTQHTALSEDRFEAWDALVEAGAKVIDSGVWFGEKPRGSEQSADLQMEKWWDEAAGVAEGGFHSRFDELGKRSGGPSPYYDGESLLAITKAGKYLGPAYAHLWPLAAGTASSLYDFHVVKARHKDEDSSDTKGCFQWLSMSLFELSTVTFGTGRKSRFDLPTAIQKLYCVEDLGAHLVDLAMWMVDVHQTLKRGRNTGYAYEGITPAWAWAAHIIKSPDIETDKDTVANARKLHCTIQTGMDKLISWQVGMGAEASDEIWNGKSGLGGVQNAADESGLRIDVTQHQMHATILARRYVYQDEDAAFPWIEAHRAKTRKAQGKAAARDGTQTEEI
mmetsp:Transcript_19813/g.44159  ORF Transcript_19813/g.44159 Transcript_19813/m.44159 type:complete len:705 (+) Transcript_19813:295-2409(+)